MRSFSASSVVRFAWQFSLAPRLVLLDSCDCSTTQQPDLWHNRRWFQFRLGSESSLQPLRSVAGVDARRTNGPNAKSRIGFRKVHVRAQDEIWLVSARNGEQCELTSRKLVNGQWVAASMAELAQSHAMDKQKTSLVYVHGNRTDEVFARSRGLQFYENLFNGQMCSGPIRFVIFAWHSEREKCGLAS